MVWISVNHRLPKHNEDVIVFDGEGRFQAYYNATKDEPNWYQINNGDYTEGGYGQDYEVKNVTHWLPLPEPPSK